MEDRRIIQLNVGQSFLGFLWAILFTQIVKAVFTAQESTLKTQSLHVIKCSFAVAAAIIVVGLVHTFWGWAEQVISLEDFARRTTIDRLAFVTSVSKLTLMTGGGILYIIVFLVTTYKLFPTVLNGYEALFVGTLWPVWMVTVVIAVWDRLGGDA